MENAWAEGVADGGNQIMVEVGIGVGEAVGKMGMGVAFNASSTAQALVIIVIARRMHFPTKQSLDNWEIASGLRPRNDIRNDIRRNRKIIMWFL